VLVVALVVGVAAGSIARRRSPVAASLGASPAGEPAAAAAGSGAALYALHCAACHGVRGEGQPNWKVPGPDGRLPAPPHDSTGHTWHHSDEVLLEIIALGGTLYSAESNMPAFEGVLTRAEMAAILRHIKGMWGPAERAQQEHVSRPSGGDGVP
jgi:mono/diheme cytochrome c family protein